MLIKIKLNNLVNIAIQSTPPLSQRGYLMSNVKVFGILKCKNTSTRTTISTGNRYKKY
jgi:hypothetical protein